MVFPRGSSLGACLTLVTGRMDARDCPREPCETIIATSHNGCTAPYASGSVRRNGPASGHPPVGGLITDEHAFGRTEMLAGPSEQLLAKGMQDPPRLLNRTSTTP